VAGHHGRLVQHMMMGICRSQGGSPHPIREG
jgi:hypothetical protein